MYPAPLLDPAKTQPLAALLERIRNASKPVLSEDMVMLMKAGKEVPIELAIFTELSNTGVWDEQQIVALIKAKFFAFVVVTGGLSSPSRYTASVRQAIEAAYPHIVKYDGRRGYWVYLPAD